MFKATHSNPKQLYYIFNSFSGLLNDFTLYIKEDGLYISELDNSHIAMIMMELNCDDFETYECSECFEIGLNLKNFVSLLKAGCSSNKIIFSTANNSDELDISFSTSYDIKEYSIKLMDIDTNNIEPTDMDYYCEFDISPNIFNDIIDSSSVTGATEIKTMIRDNKLTFLSEGDMGKLMQTFKAEDISESKTMIIKGKDGSSKTIPHPKNKNYILHSCSGNFSNSFSLPMLSIFKKASSLVNKVSVNISPEVPIRLDMMLNDTTGSMINLYLAPKITDD